jgi:hypothetical protein
MSDRPIGRHEPIHAFSLEPKHSVADESVKIRFVVDAIQRIIAVILIHEFGLQQQVGQDKPSACNLNAIVINSKSPLFSSSYVFA